MEEQMDRRLFDRFCSTLGLPADQDFVIVAESSYVTYVTRMIRAPPGEYD